MSKSLQMTATPGPSRSTRVTVSRRAVLTLLAALVLVSAWIAQPGQARSSRRASPGRLLVGCDHQLSSIPVPAAVATRYLPKGFSPSGGPAGQDEIVYVSIGSIACVEDSAEQVMLTYAAVWVDPPDKMERKGAAHVFVIDAIHRGSDSDKFVQRLCLTGIVGTGELSASVRRDIGGTGISRTTGTAMSDALNVRWHMVTSGAAGQKGEATRLFFGPKGRTHVDMFEVFSFLGVGESSVVFEQPYLDLPPASVVPSWYKHGVLMFRPKAGCR